MPNATAEIITWAKDNLKYWEQYLLERILKGQPITDTERNQARQYFLHELFDPEKFAQKPDIDFPEIREEDAHQTWRLKAIENVQDVNRLADGQRIEFGPRLTVIFGNNGAGKSGYARVLACAGNSRGDKRVLPNVTKPGCSRCVPRADFIIQDEAGQENTVAYSCNGPSPDLSFVHVFDSTSVEQHLKENDFSFTPASLESLERLVAETDAVRQLLKGETERLRTPHQFLRHFAGESEVTKALRELSAKTDLKALKQLATPSEPEQQELATLKKSLAAIEALDIDKKTKAVNQLRVQAETLQTGLDQIQVGLSEEKVSTLVGSMEGLKKALALAKATGAKQFKSEFFTTVGSKAWQQFMAQAKALGEEEAEQRGTPYPQPEDHCLLCGQPLGEEALERFTSLWKYLEGETQKTFNQAQQALVRQREQVQSLNTNLLREDSVLHQHLRDTKNPLLDEIRTYLEACATLKTELLAAADTLKHEAFTALPANPAGKVTSLIQGFGMDLEALAKQDTSKEIKELEIQILPLEHRVKFAEIWDEVENHANRLLVAADIEDSSGNSRHISSKSTSMLNELIGGDYMEAFQHYLDVLHRPLGIHPKLKASKGKATRKIELETGEAEAMRGVSAVDVLSEGERKAVALADFLAEISLHPTCGCLVFDDPVNSLDNGWKESTANILVEQAKNHQSIIFTHDLHFLSLLLKSRENHEVACCHSWVVREGDIPGAVYNNACPSFEQKYAHKKAEIVSKIIEEARPIANPENKQRILMSGFSALRTCYEAMIVDGILGGVVTRFNPKIKPGNLKEAVFDHEIADEICAKYGDICRYIEGHLHADGAHAQPTIDKLENERLVYRDYWKKINKHRDDYKKGKLAQKPIPPA